MTAYSHPPNTQHVGKIFKRLKHYHQTCLKTLFCLFFKVYSSTEHLATPSNLSFSSDRSHSEDKEERGEVGGAGLSPSSAESSVEKKHPGRMARWRLLRNRVSADAGDLSHTHCRFFWSELWNVLVHFSPKCENLSASLKVIGFLLVLQQAAAKTP